MCVAKALLIKLGLKHQGYSVTCIYGEWWSISSANLIFFCMFETIYLIQKQYHNQIWIGTLQSIDCLLEQAVGFAEVPCLVELT